MAESFIRQIFLHDQPGDLVFLQPFLDNGHKKGARLEITSTEGSSLPDGLLIGPARYGRPRAYHPDLLLRVLFTASLAGGSMTPTTGMGTLLFKTARAIALDVLQATMSILMPFSGETRVLQGVAGNGLGDLLP